MLCKLSQAYHLQRSIRCLEGSCGGCWMGHPRRLEGADALPSLEGTFLSGNVPVSSNTWIYLGFSPVD